MKRLLVANRGEIALRVIRAARGLGLETVAVFSEADRNSPHVWAADRAVCIGAAPAAQSYLNAGALLEAARGAGCDALHPGYGFLAENAEFAAQCREEGLSFVGPPPEVIALMGDKAAARRTAAGLGVAVVPGSQRVLSDATGAGAAAEALGFPVLLKASAGGGGRGMRIARTPAELAAGFDQAQGEAKAAFGDGALYLERYLPRVRHIEVQVFGDQAGTIRELGERDCSVQRRHQKLVEEAPSPVLDDAIRRRIRQAALALAEGIGYVNAGTVEFVYDMDTSAFHFIEMNTRIQVEHPVTEALTGLDLVREQLRVAAGRKLSFESVAAEGHAIEWRLNAEDPDRDFRPSPGRITRWRPGTAPGMRLDSHVYEGYELSPHYDSLLGKLIVWGRDRSEALDRSALALGGFEAAGVHTTIPFHRALLRRQEFIDGEVHTRWIEEAMGPRDDD
jgi:acetyl-CoA carboxylase biotin carboxylase subunit